MTPTLVCTPMQSRDRRPTTAVVIDKPSATMIEDEIGTSEKTLVVVRAPVRWRVDRVDHTETLNVDSDAKVVDQVDIWVDHSGYRVAVPTPMSQAGIDALMIGAASWLGLMACAASLTALARAGLARRRGMGWDRELRSLVDHGGGRTGSQT